MSCQSLDFSQAVKHGLMTLVCIAQTETIKQNMAAGGKIKSFRKVDFYIISYLHNISNRRICLRKRSTDAKASSAAIQAKYWIW